MEEDVKYCLNCKRDISAKNYVIHTVHCERNIQLCSRCSEPVPRSEIEKHEEEFHSKVSCSECGISVEKWQIEKHQETCAKKLVPCEYCELEVPLDNFSEHTAACGSRTEQCPECKKYVMRKDLGKHPINCSRREPETVPCEYCEGQINVSEIMEHTVICGTRTERCFLCNEHVMVKDRDTHFITCGKELNFNELISCDYCGGSFSNSVIGRHVEFCEYRMEKCNECNNDIERKDMKSHLIMCKQKRHLSPKVSSPCKYCEKLFPDFLLKDHIDLCGSQNRRCEKCEKYIPLKNMEMHVNTCRKKRQINPEFPCKYCGELYLVDFLEDHADKCGNRTKKCEKCDKFIVLKNMERHSNVCKDSMSKTHGDCPICHQSIPWIEMNVHSAYCAQVNSEIHEYTYQNEINEITLKKEHEVLKKETSDEKKSKLDENPKRCSFCFENFPCYQFPQHLIVCEERPYNCDVCLKAMPNRKKEEHKCLSRRTKSHADDYLLHDEETDDNKEMKKFKKCQFCDGRFPDVVFQHHLKECEHRKEKCTYCLENIPLKDIQDHKLRKCSFTRLAENKNFNYHNNANAEAFPEPSKNFERMRYIEENVEICPSCTCRIPKERYHDHLILCYNEETQCHFCGIKILKKNEHSHFRVCDKILQMVKEDNNPPSKKKKGNTNKGKTLTGFFTSLWNPSHKEKSFERNNVRQDSQESDTWQSKISLSYKRDNITYPTTGLNVVNELPCEFCNQLWPSELLIEHESGCRPDLVSFPKADDGNDCDEKFAAAATTVSQISHTPVLDASPKSIAEEDSEWKMSRRNRTSIKERVDYREREKNAPQKQINAKEKFFYYPSQDTDDTSRNQPSIFRKKRYPQTKESQEPFKTKSDPRPKDDPKKNQFTSFKFSSFKNDDESENDSHSRREDGDELSTDIKKYNETKSDFYNPQALSAESSVIVDYPKSDFIREIKAIGSERTERKRIMHSRKDVHVNKDFEEKYAQKLIPFDENIKSEPSKVLETSESKTFNQTMSALWNTESTSIDKTLRSHSLKFFDDNEVRHEALYNASENIDNRAFSSSTQETDYDTKNNETFGSSFVESINNNQNQENENDTKSERSNSDDIFYDADDGNTKCFDIENDNFHDRSTSQEEKASHYDFQNLNFDSSNQKYKINSSNHEDFNTDIRVEEEDLSQKDCDLGGYFQFLHKSIKQSGEAAQRMIGDMEKLSCRTAGICKCHNAKCSCELSSLPQKASFQTHSFEDASCSTIRSEPMDIEQFGTETKIQNEIKPKKNIEFSSEKKIENEKDEMKWKKWRVSQEKVFSSDSE